MLKQNLNI